jgi:Ca-activated chloride channel homolog
LSTEQEVVYILPLPPDASVYSFKATFNDGRTVKGVVKEKHQASEEYKAAVAAGKRAALLQKVNDEGKIKLSKIPRT